jgi:hypothetical protein
MGSEPQPAPYTMDTGTVSLAVKLQAREADHSPPSDEIKNGGAICTWSGAYLITVRNNFTFTVSFISYGNLCIHVNEAKYSSETSVDFQWTTQRYIPENRIIQNMGSKQS